jgi:two-component system OmpR family sensor kinase
LQRYEKKAFTKFFSIYFGSVALLILTTGHFYYVDQKKEFLKEENFSMIDYARMFKMKTPIQNTDITHEIKKIDAPYISISNFKVEKDYFYKYVPHDWADQYMLIKKPKSGYDKKIYNLKHNIIWFQFLLLSIFASISYFLSKMALKPIHQAVTKLDNFSKDLIHDINTPITSILLNMKLLKKDAHFASNKYLNRISKNVKDIHALNSNLTILLKENTLDVQNIDIFKIIDAQVKTYKKLYPSINFSVDKFEYVAKINEDALRQIISNLLSNSAKYSSVDAKINIYMQKNTLYIKDNGQGIKNPSSVFKRNYKEHESGHGIGLDIAKRLCDAMGVNIAVSSKENEGSEFSLEF